MSNAPQDTPQDIVQAPLGELPAAGNTTPSAREQADMGTVLPIAEVAARLGVSVKTAYRAVRAGKYPGAYKQPGTSGEQWVVPVSTVEQLLSKAVPKSQDIVQAQAQALLAQVHDLEIQLTQARTEAMERGKMIEFLQDSMRQLSVATDTLAQAADLQRDTIVTTQAALQAALNRKWWQRRKPEDLPQSKLQP